MNIKIVKKDKKKQKLLKDESDKQIKIELDDGKFILFDNLEALKEQ